jgi:hypothetical protein
MSDLMGGTITVQINTSNLITKNNVLFRWSKRN